VVLTGGEASLEGITALATDVFGMGARVGVPGQQLEGLVEQVASPRFATAVGLALYGAQRAVPIGGASRRVALGGGGVDRLAARVKGWLQDFF
jgi:cell division protein FtsA